MTKRMLYGASFALLLVAPFVAAAAGSAAVDVELLPGSVENVLELVILVISLVAAVSAIKLAALAQGGSLEKTWNRVAIAVGFFALLEINNALAGFELLHIGGLSEILEVVFAVTLLVALIQTRRDLLKQVLGK